MTKTTEKKLSTMFKDEFVASAFRRSENDGLAPLAVEADRPRTLDGGAIAAIVAEEMENV